MPRQKGSLNKKKNTSLKVLNFDRQIDGSAINKVSTFGWINWGENNDYPDLLLSLYNQSPTHHAAIQFALQAVIGDGVDYDAMSMDSSQLVPNPNETWDELLKNLTLDYLLFGSFSIEIIAGKGGNYYNFYHVPLHKVRWAEFDENGKIPGYYISSDWTSTSLNPPEFIDAFDMEDEYSIEVGKPYLYVYKSYTPTQQYYTSPHYIAGLQAIQAEVQHCLYDLKTTTNSFIPSGMLVLPEMEQEADKQAVLREISKMFQGSSNANALMTVFRSNVDENKPEFIPFAANVGNVNLFEASNLRTQARILAAHSIPDASLCGLPAIGNNGFASEAAKLETGYKVYLKLTGINNRNTILTTINFMLKMNGIDTEIILKPFSFDLDENEIKTENKPANESVNEEINNDLENTEDIK